MRQNAGAWWQIAWHRSFLEGLTTFMLLTDVGLQREMTLEDPQFRRQEGELFGYDLNTATFTLIRSSRPLDAEEVAYRLKKAGWKNTRA